MFAAIISSEEPRVDSLSLRDCVCLYCLDLLGPSFYPIQIAWDCLSDSSSIFLLDDPFCPSLSFSCLSLKIFSFSALTFHFSMFYLPDSIWRSSIAGQISASWAKMGITTNWMNPACPPAMLVVVLSHIIDISRPWASSMSPWLKNSSKRRSAHWVLMSKSLREVLISHACSTTLDTSCLLFSRAVGLEKSISFSTFFWSWISNLFRWF